MKWIVGFALCLVLNLGASDKALSADLSLSDLRAICASPDPVNTRVCQFYIFGVSEGILLGRQTAMTPSLFCFPEGLDAQKMATRVREMMRLLDNKSADLPAAAMVGAALNNAYPCPKPN